MSAIGQYANTEVVAARVEIRRVIRNARIEIKKLAADPQVDASDKARIDVALLDLDRIESAL